jgi:hypothetical protein
MWWDGCEGADYSSCDDLVVYAKEAKGRIVTVEGLSDLLRVSQRSLCHSELTLRAVRSGDALRLYHRFDRCVALP